MLPWIPFSGSHLSRIVESTLSKLALITNLFPIPSVYMRGIQAVFMEYIRRQEQREEVVRSLVVLVVYLVQVQFFSRQHEVPSVIHRFVAGF